MQSETEPLLVTTREAARLLGLSESHLQKLRHFRKPGPPLVRIGRAVRYPAAGLREWAAARLEGGEV